MTSLRTTIPILTALFAQGTVQVFTKTEVIPTKKTFFQIISGYVALYEDNGNDHKKLLFIFGKNDIIPYPFQGHPTNQKRLFRYCALDTTQVRAVSSDTVDQAIRDNQEIGQAFMRYCAFMLDMAFMRVADMEHLTVLDRLTKRLLFFAERFGVKGENRIVVDIPLTHTDIALSIGATRETVNRILNQLQKEGRISVVDRRIIIHKAAFPVGLDL